MIARNQQRPGAVLILSVAVIFSLLLGGFIAFADYHAVSSGG